MRDGAVRDALPQTAVESEQAGPHSHGKLRLSVWIRAFSTSRLTGRARLHRWNLRATEELLAPAVTARRQEPPSEMPADARSTGSLRSHIVRRWKLLTAMRRQMKRIDRHFRKTGDTEVGVLALGVTRQLPLGLTMTVRSQVRSITEALPGARSPHLVSDRLLASQTLVLVDPARLCDLWEDPEACWREGVYIVDSVFLAFALLTSPLHAAIGLWALKTEIRTVLRERLPLRLSCHAVAITIGYQCVFRGVRRMQAVLVNGNSVATEVLRAFLIATPECSDIVEVLHGTPSVELEEYLAMLFRAAPAGGKHRFVPHVPQHSFGIYSAQLASDQGFAVNLAFNHYRLARRVHPDAVAAETEDELRALAGIDHDSPVLVVTFAGANSHDAAYFRSNTFALEQALLQHCRRTLDSLGVPFVLLYTPHPLHRWSDVTGAPFFSSAAVLIHPNSILAWLAGDLCIALYSSALWDARFAGLHAFTPLRSSDGIYPRFVLDELSHPEDTQGMFEALTGFLRTHAEGHSGGDIRERIRRRAHRFWS